MNIIAVVVTYNRMELLKQDVGTSVVFVGVSVFVKTGGHFAYGAEYFQWHNNRNCRFEPDVHRPHRYEDRLQKL